MPTTIDITVKRGDTKTLVFVVKDKTGAIVPTTGWTGLVLTIDPAKAPADNANNVESITGSVVDGAGGKLGFQPAGTTDIGTYYYDAQGLDAGGEKVTIAEGKFKITQDISKG